MQKKNKLILLNNGDFLKIISLNKLLFKYFCFINFPDIYISGISCDSRLIKKNNLFIALKGYHTNGRYFISNAVYNGAVAVLTYSNIKKSYYLFNYQYKIYIFYLKKIDIFLSDIISKFYNYPGKKLISVGVTGTNGKTTVVNLCSQWAYILGYKSAMLSTIGNGFYGSLSPSLNTTVSSLELQSELNFFYKKSTDFVFIEVSSHSLIQRRVENVYFSSAVFTNLSLDHLDYHINIKNYELAKLKLFSEYKIKNLIINIDDPIGYYWFKNLLPIENIIPVTCNFKYIKLFKYRWIYIKKIEYYGFLKKIFFLSSWGNGIIKLFLIGDFNIKNFFLSFITLLSLNLNLKDLLDSSKYLILPKGRLEFIKKKNYSLIIIDYAHTPIALKNILLESRKYCQGKLWCIFGCTGNRDKNKRPIMGSIAKKYSDIIIITNDDVYYENEISIINDIKLGINNFNNVFIILNRILAIKFAIKNSSKYDVILIAGKGHENFHFIFGKKIKYSDKYWVSKLLGI